MSDRVKLVIYRVLLALSLILLVYVQREKIGRFMAGIPEDKISSEDITSLAESGDGIYNAGEARAETGYEIDSFNSTAYGDERKPEYPLVYTFSQDPISIEFTWTSYEQLYFATICYSIDEKLYDYYKGLSRYYGDGEYINYIKDPLNDEYIEMLVENLDEIAGRRGYTDGEKVREAINFVQSFEYVDDTDTSSKVEWPKYPIETLYERKGDCEDTSILLAGILAKMGYGTCLIKYSNHMAVGLKADDTATGAHFNYDGLDYYYIETTNKGWDIGEIPDDYKDLNATVIVIN